MKFEDLIKTIYGDKRYLSLCYKISNGSHLSEDLWHICIEEIYKHPDRIVKANDEKYLEVYIVGMLYRLWNQKTIVKTYKKSTSDLYMYCDNEDSWSEYKEHLNKITGDERQAIKAAVNELNKKLKSKEETEVQNAQLVWDVCNSNVWQVSKKNGVNHMKVKRAFIKTINQIKRNIDE